jgi:cytochrome c oxidase cbb3-type subunit I/II
MGEGIYDRPFLWGSKRTGPDLAREGVLRPSAAWHYFHLQRPSSMSSATVMPNYPWLCSDDMDLGTLPRKLEVLSAAPLFTPYTRGDIDHAVADARAQAGLIADELRKEPRLKDAQDLEKKEIIAVIAYLQRLGTDLGKPAPVAKPVAGGR